jgi:D-glycero-alpha-D-manno-heptose-7-phosphate kinase
MPTKMELAREAIRIEQDVLQEAVGCQDQVLAAFGGFLRLDFEPDGEILVTPLVLVPARLREIQDHLMLFFAGFARTASTIAREQVERTPSLTRELSALQALVPEAQALLCSNRDLLELGRMLHEHWLVKRSLTSQVSTPEIDALYEKARRAGALGGKLIGAGGGGFLLLFAAPERQASVRTALGRLLEVPFHFERGGSQLVVYQPDRAAESRGSGDPGQRGE